MSTPLAPLSDRLEQFRALWESTHRAAYEAVRQTEADLAGLVQELQARLAEPEEGAPGLVSADDLRDRVHQLCAWADGAAARLPRVRSALTRRAKRQGRFSVVLFGRTQAGKSTIREALMGVDGGTVGKGGQRTTRRPREYEWGSCTVVDTPGIGGYEVASDREQALEAAASADVVLFILSSDGFQLDTFDGLAALRRQNTPVLFVLNVRRDLTRPVFRRKFLDDPAVCFQPEELRGQTARIQRLASERLNLTEVEVYPVHAQAAHMGAVSEDGDSASRLWEASRLSQLVDALARELSDRAVIHRLQTTTDGVVCPLSAQRIQAMERVRRLACERDTLELLEKEVVDRTGARWADGRARVCNTVEVLANELRSEIGEFIEQHGDDDDIEEQWQSLVDRYSHRLQGEVQRLAEETGLEVEAEVAALVAEVETVASVPLGTCVAPGVVPRPRSFGRALGVGGTVLAGLISKFAPGHWKLIAIPFAGAGWAGHKVDKRASTRWSEDTTETLAWTVDQWMTGNLKGAAEAFVSSERDLRGQLHRAVGAQVAELCQLEQDHRDLADSVSRRVRDLNRGLIASVASLLGARDAESLSRVARQPGRRTWVVWPGLQDETLLASVGDALGEHLYAAPVRTRGQRVSALLGQAGVDVHRVTVLGGKEARVVLGAGLSPEDVETESILLAEDLTGLRLTITREG